MAESLEGAAAGADHVDILAAQANGSSNGRAETAETAEFSSPTEKVLAEVLAEVLGVERVAADGNFFDDLSADSMVMARFCARVRKRPDLPPVSMKDVYQNPTMRSLATAVGSAAPASAEQPAPAQRQAPDLPGAPVQKPASAPRNAPDPKQVPTWLPAS